MRKPHILEYEAAINDQTQFSVIDETISQGKGVDRKISSNMKLKSLIPSSACATTACMDQSGTDGSPASDETTTVAGSRVHQSPNSENMLTPSDVTLNLKN